MNNEKITHFKKKLELELQSVEAELKSLGWKSPVTGEWEATGGDIDMTATESDELADREEEYEESRLEIEEIQIHWRAIKRALEKIEDGVMYSVCEVCKTPIEEDRLEANPSARTCKAHMDNEEGLDV